jgi:hypothetical protein
VATNGREENPMKLDLEVRNDAIAFGDHFSIRFQRTLRIPDNGRSYPLPPGLGAFPLRRVDDYRERVPSEWLEHGGVFLPMYQREAMWLSFGSLRPHALKVGIGKVCAITGKPWRESLHADPQDYLVAPPQPWLDGIAIGGGRIRQFVAMPLGMGYTVEGQVTGEEAVGGIQIKLFRPKPGRIPEPEVVARRGPFGGFGAPPPCAAPAPMCCAAPPAAGSPYRSKAASESARPTAGQMGLAAGGRMEQKVYPDPYGIDAWDEDATARIFVHIVNSELWREITGERPPETPVTAKEYRKHGLPWFALYDEGMPTLDGQSTLKRVKSVAAMDEEKFDASLMDDTDTDPSVVKKLYLLAKHLVRDGQW